MVFFVAVEVDYVERGTVRICKFKEAACRFSMQVRSDEDVLITRSQSREIVKELMRQRIRNGEVDALLYRSLCTKNTRTLSQYKGNTSFSPPLPEADERQTMVQKDESTVWKIMSGRQME